MPLSLAEHKGPFAVTFGQAQGHQDGEERKEYAGKPKFVKIQDDVEPVKHMQTLSLRCALDDRW